MRNRSQKIVQIQTGNRQPSDIDLLSKLQSSFLQKYFKYNLIDYFPQLFTNLYQQLFHRKINIKTQKYLLSSLFLTKCKIHLNELTKNINQFYRYRSKSIKEQQLEIAFQQLYPLGNLGEQPIQQQQLLVIDVKIKIEVQKIQQQPLTIIVPLQNLKKRNEKPTTSQLQLLLQNYKKQHINIFFVYFGDINFQLFNQQNFQIQNIKILDRNYRVRIFVFFVSKQALIESFIFLNKLDNLAYINDLVIQFYQLKRDKQRKKNNKNNANIQRLFNNNKKSEISISAITFGVLGVVGLITFGLSIRKLLF